METVIAYQYQHQFQIFHQALQVLVHVKELLMNYSQRLVFYKLQLLQNHCLKFHKLNLLVHQVIQIQALVRVILALDLVQILTIIFNLRLK